MMRQENAARFAAQIFSYINERARTALRDSLLYKLTDLDEEDSKLQSEYRERGTGVFA
jgi:hypothetical protein